MTSQDENIYTLTMNLAAMKIEHVFFSAITEPYLTKEDRNKHSHYLYKYESLYSETA